MVKGDWIVFPKEMRCKNWVNGIEVHFHFNETCQIEGKIQYIPPHLIERIPFILNPATFLFRIQRQATLMFRKIYYKKYQGSLPAHPPAVRITDTDEFPDCLDRPAPQAHCSSESPPAWREPDP